MSILSGFIKTKKYRKTETGYQLQSEWTSSDTVEMADGKTLTDTVASVKNQITSHSQGAGSITTGTFHGDVTAPPSANYTANMIRNAAFTTSDPGEGTATSYANGSIICVYEEG